MANIIDRIKERPVKEVIRWFRIPLIAALAFWLFQDLSSLYAEQFHGWLVVAKLNLLSCLFALLVVYVFDRCLAHGDRAHDLTGMELQVRNGVRVIGACLVALALSGA